VLYAERAVQGCAEGGGIRMSDNVNHPAHYVKDGRKECIVEMIEKYGEVPVYWFCMLNAYKYEYRAGLKGDAETDLQKAEWYRNYAYKLMDEASTKCCNMKTIPIECYNELKKKLKETT
jgi:hypothetical protein